MRLVHGTPHVGPTLPDRIPTPHDELRAATPPGAPAMAGSIATRILQVLERTPIYDHRGTPAGSIAAGELVPVAKGIGGAGQIVHVITAGRHAGRIIYRHRGTYVSAGDVDVGPTPFRGGEGPS